MRFITLAVFIFLVSISSFGQSKLRAYLDHKQYYAKESGNYIEFQLHFVGHSITYLENEEGMKGDVAVFMDIYQGDSLVVDKAYRLESPIMKDGIIDDFYDIQRFALSPGEYLFKIELLDINSESAPLKASQLIKVSDFSESISVSDVLIAEGAAPGDGSSQFYRSGYDIIPKLSSFYPEQMIAIPIYMEVYNSNLIGDSVFFVEQTLINSETGEEVDGYSGITRLKSNEIVPVFKTLNIEELHTGKYLLRYQIMTSTEQRLSTQTYEFERSNDVMRNILAEEIVIDPAFQGSITDDSIGFYLESLIPISGASEVKNIIKIAKEKDANKARKYIQQYWVATSGTDFYESWLKYKAQVVLVERLYSNNFQEGFETDRGRVYLQYGSPTNIVRKDVSPSEYPYEIWQYNKIGIYSNKRFIFYNPDLVNNTYRLLHSDMIGELKNPAWPRELSKRNSSNGDVDNPNAGNFDHWGGNSNDYFRQY